jgi:hypothetical protein
VTHTDAYAQTCTEIPLSCQQAWTNFPSWFLIRGRKCHILLTWYATGACMESHCLLSLWYCSPTFPCPSFHCSVSLIFLPSLIIPLLLPLSTYSFTHLSVPITEQQV